MDKKDIFFYINNVYNKRYQLSSEEVAPMIWTVNRFLSMEKDLLEAVAETTKYIFTLGPRYYTLMMRLVPKSYSPRNKYLKPEKTKTELLSRYQRYFKLSMREVADYMKILYKKYSEKEIYDFVGLQLEGK